MNTTPQDNHDKMVARLCKPGEDILSTLDGFRMSLLINSIAAFCRIGHQADMVKKATVYNKGEVFDVLPKIHEVPAAMRHIGEVAMMTMTVEKAELVHMAVAICGEAAEIAEAVLNFVIRNKGLDKENMLEEEGDMEFYLNRLRSILGHSRNQVLKHNTDKLAVRYGQSYSDSAAIARVDKKSVENCINNGIGVLNNEIEEINPQPL